MKKILCVEEQLLLKPPLSRLFRIITIASCFFMIIAIGLFADDINYQVSKRNITGVVVDERGEAIIGANVVEKGTTNGIITDVDGNFSLRVDNNAFLQITYIGYLSQEIKITGNNHYHIELQEDLQNLDEVVVIGYGTKAKSTVTGAISTVGEELFKSKPQANVINTLQGMIPNLQITRSGGEIGYENQGMQLRGTTSRSDPGVLIIIDGIPQSNSSAEGLNNLNPNDIENISVLKDAQAAIYGARAAGGVMLITTKRGKSDKPKITYTANFALNTPGIMPRKVNLNQLIEMESYAWESDGIDNHQFSDLKSRYPFVLDGKGVEKGPFGDTPDVWLGDRDWYDYMFGSAFMQKHDISISGNSKRSQYYLSVGYLNEGSMLKYGDSKNKRYFVRGKYDFDITDWLTVGTNITLESKKLTRPYDTNTIYYLLGESWNSFDVFTPKGNWYGFGGGGFINARAWAEAGGESEQISYRIRPTFNAILKPLKGLEIIGQFSSYVDIYDDAWIQKKYETYDWYDNPASRNVTRNRAGSEYRKRVQQVANLYATYNFDIKNHKFTIMAGGSHEEMDQRDFSAHRYDLLTEDLKVMTTGDANEQYNSEWGNDWVIKSVFARFDYNFAGKYFVEATVRSDGSSKFADGYRWGTFPGVSAGWIISEEKFMEKVKPLFSYIKLRASYGELGNQSNVGLYDHYSRISITGAYPFGSYSSPSRDSYAKIAAMTSKDRTWETVRVNNFGLEFYTLNDRLSVNFDYFIKNTRDMLVTRELPAVLGATPPTVNGGSLRVNGYELSVSWRDQIQDFKYNVQLNFSDFTNKVTKLEDVQIPNFGLNNFVQGYPVGTYFGYDFDGFIQNESERDSYSKINGVPSNIRVGDARYKDLDGDGIMEKRLYVEGDPNSGDMIAIADNNMRYQYSAVLGFEYKSFDFSAIFQGIGKWMVVETDMPLGGAWYRSPSAYFYGNTWTQEQTNSEYPRLTANGGIGDWNYNISNASYKLWNNRYLRLKNVTVGYSLPKSFLNKWSIDGIRVYFSGSDLWEIKNIPDNFDPEAPFRIAYAPFPRTYSLGLNVTF